MNTENNKLIAEFMGWEFNLYENLPNICHKGDFSLHIANIKYHSDWNWLMEVIKECYSKKHNENSYYEAIYYALADLNIEAVYNACVEFVKYYNQQNNNVCETCTSKKLTNLEICQLDDFISVERHKIKKRNALLNVNGGFCNIDFVNCNTNVILLDCSYGISDGYDRDFRKKEIELNRDTFEIINERDYQRVSQEFEKKEIIINL